MEISSPTGKLLTDVTVGQLSIPSINAKFKTKTKFRIVQLIKNVDKHISKTC